VHEAGVEPASLSALEPKDAHPDSDSCQPRESTSIEDTARDGSEPFGAPCCDSLAIETPARQTIEGQSPQPPADPVEAALAGALQAAATAGDMSALALVAGELRARRLAREGVADLQAARDKRGGRP
jgi:hypothetical protein